MNLLPLFEEQQCWMATIQAAETFLGPTWGAKAINSHVRFFGDPMLKHSIAIEHVHSVIGKLWNISVRVNPVNGMASAEDIHMTSPDQFPLFCKRLQRICARMPRVAHHDPAYRGAKPIVAAHQTLLLFTEALANHPMTKDWFFLGSKRWNVSLGQWPNEMGLTVHLAVERGEDPDTFAIGVALTRPLMGPSSWPPFTTYTVVQEPRDIPKVLEFIQDWIQTPPPGVRRSAEIDLSDEMNVMP